VNAGLFAVSLLAGTDATLAAKLTDFRGRQEDKVRAMTLPPAKP
jgi:5-(carboxyamino)imidazole ribonucleotide mutase